MSQAGPRIAFFGLAGQFASRPLKALHAAGLSPRLVVEGVEGPPQLRDRSRYLGAQPGPILRRLGLGTRATGSGLASTALALGIDAIQTQNANTHRVRQWLSRVRPDAFVVCGFHHLLSRELLRMPRRGGINLHPGRLPEERGPAPLFWALKAGRTDLAWTLHLLDEGEDTGDVVATGSYPIEPGMRGLDILEGMAVAAVPALLRAARALLDGDLIRWPQSPPTGPRGPRPGFRDGRIDAGRSARAVYTFVAGCAGRYPLFVESAGDRYFIADAESYDPEANLAFEYALTGDRLLLRCNPGIVELRLRPDGALFAAEF